MSFISELINCLDWLHTANSLRKDFSGEYETERIYANGRKPNEVARQRGRGWQVGYVEWDTGLVVLHKKK